MPWEIPTAKAIAASMAATLEMGVLRLRPALDPLAISRAVRSARGVFAQILRAVSAELREVHDHQAWWGRQYMPDSADDEAMILRHADIWGIAPRAAIAAVGSVRIEGIPGTSLPAGIGLAAEGVAYVTSRAAVLDGAGVAVVAVRAVTAGLSGNLATGARMTTVEPRPEVTDITVSTALLGGADAWTISEIKAATLERIRMPPQGGAVVDYPRWVAEVAAVRAVGVVPDWIGWGSLGVVVVMADPDGGARAPTQAEIDMIQSHIGVIGGPGGTKPVTARAIVVAGAPVPMRVRVRVRPDTDAVRDAVERAFERFVASIGDEEDTDNDSPIGAKIEISRLSEAISASSGEYAHDLLAPSASYRLGRAEFPLPAGVDFVP